MLAISMRSIARLRRFFIFQPVEVGEIHFLEIDPR